MIYAETGFENLRCENIDTYKWYTVQYIYPVAKYFAFYILQEVNETLKPTEQISHLLRADLILASKAASTIWTPETRQPTLLPPFI